MAGGSSPKGWTIVQASQERGNSVRRVSERPRFNIEKATEATAYLIQLCSPRRPIKFMKILKLLYLAEREALREWERPIIYDSYCSMDHGQVLSNTYNLMKRQTRYHQWDEHIQHRWYLWLALRKPVQLRKLSRAEAELLERIANEYGHLKEFELAELTHQLPEYKEAHGSSIPTTMADLLGALEFSEEDIQRIRKQLEDRAVLDSIFAG